MIASTDGANIEIAEEVCIICALPDLLTNNLINTNLRSGKATSVSYVIIF